MCLIAWNWQPGSDTPLLLIANRDEFYTRPALPLHWWEGEQILAGRDLQAGGTWLGVSRNGLLAALTNFRDPAANRPDAPSRGTLVTDFLESNLSAGEYLHQLAPTVDDYNPFNLLVFDGECLLGLESRHDKVITMGVGVGAVSNADFHTPWPKLSSLKTAFQQQLESQPHRTDPLMQLLKDGRIAEDAELPSTGIPVPLERMLSSIFIVSPAYGTRACSMVQMGRNTTTFSEVCFDHTGFTGRRDEAFSAGLRR